MNDFLCSYDCKVSALTWDPLRRYLFVGLENGHVQVGSIL